MFPNKAYDNHRRNDILRIDIFLVRYCTRILHMDGCHNEVTKIRFYFPDSPINAKFLTTEEKRIAVLRMKVNEAGVENKRFKVEQ